MIIVMIVIVLSDYDRAVASVTWNTFQKQFSMTNQPKKATEGGVI